MLDNFSYKILNSLTDGIYVIDKEFKIVFINKVALDLVGITKDEVEGKYCRAFCKSDRCLLGCPVSELLKTNKNIHELETTIQHKNGNIIPIKLNASLIYNEDNQPIGSIISFKKNEKIDFEEYLKNIENFYGIVGKSKSMLEIFKTIKEIATSDANVLITGETGVGKELIANAIKETSQRRNNIYVKVNCAVLPDTLLASELFGHVKGAFTDAQKDRIGRFEYANNGTIFLDEIAELPYNMQARLLRIIQNGTFERLGESFERKVDVRIIAATNKDLNKEIKEQRFREDLYFRLNVIPIFVPPLRERKEDILILTNYFIKKFSNKYNKKIEEADNETLDIFYNYEWPGNVRELENTIEYAFIRSKRNDVICSCCLPPFIRDNKKCTSFTSIKQFQDDEKVQTIISLLRQNNWNKSKVAKILGINRSTLHRKLKALNPNQLK